MGGIGQTPIRNCLIGVVPLTYNADFLIPIMPSEWHPLANLNFVQTEADNG